MAGTIGRGTWIDKLAHELVRREESLGRGMSVIRVESGLGASGIPHVGSLADAVRAYGVALALGDMGYRSELIAYSDDLDGLRKVPDGMPASLAEHLGRPVSDIPDPHGCCASYGSHMSSMLLEGLDMLGVRYEFRSAAETYSRGLLERQVRTILSEAGRIGAKIAEVTGQQKYVSRLPYFPVCAACGRLYTTEPLGYDPGAGAVEYRCSGTEVGGARLEGCGHAGESRIGRDPGKLAWKAEFAARWAAFDVRFEAYGKDIMDSVRINDWVSEAVLGFAPPYHARYEMFLDKGGRKISKSAGNVLTVQRWLEFATPQSILMLFYKRMTGARSLGLGDVPALMREYDALEDAYFGGGAGSNPARDARLRGLYEYANLLAPPGSPPPHADYGLLVELAGMFREDRARMVTGRLVAYGVAAGPDPALDALIGLAGRFADEFGGAGEGAVEIDAQARAPLARLADLLESDGCPDDIQAAVHEEARSAGMRAGDLFRALYLAILGAPRGPRLGPLVSDIGPARAAAAIRRRL